MALSADMVAPAGKDKPEAMPIAMVAQTTCGVGEEAMAVPEETLEKAARPRQFRSRSYHYQLAICTDQKHVPRGVGTRRDHRLLTTMTAPWQCGVHVAVAEPTRSGNQALGALEEPEALGEVAPKSDAVARRGSRYQRIGRSQSVRKAITVPWEMSAKLGIVEL